MNVLYITHNTSIRSTTCILDAVVTQLHPKEFTPIFSFPETGTWPTKLMKQGYHCHFHKFAVPGAGKPITFLMDLIYWYRLLRKENIDLVHCNEQENYLMIRRAALLLKIPVVVGIRFIMGKSYCQWAFGGKYAPAKLLFTSNDQLQRCRAALPENINNENIIMLGNGRDLVEFTGLKNERESIRNSWRAEPNEIIIGTASVIRRRKLLEDFIYLVKELVKKGYPVIGVIAGGGKYADPDYFQELKNLIRVHSLNNHMRMLGNLEKMAPFYQGIDIFISTSELETFGMSVCEAMAFSKPVVAYTGGSVAEVLGNPSCVVDVGDKEALISKVTTLLNDQEKWNDLGYKNKTRAFKHFDARVLAKRVKLIYENTTS